MRKALTAFLKRRFLHIIDFPEIKENSLKKIHDLFIHNIFLEPEGSKELFYYGVYYQDVENHLGWHHYTVDKNYDLMKKYYLMGVELGNSTVMNNLGNYYQHVEKNYGLMKKYYLMAIELGNSTTMNNLGNYYQHVEKNYDLMKKYYLMAVELGNSTAMNNLGWHYHYIEKNYNLMKKYYFMAITLEDSATMNNLAHYYQKVEKNYDLMKKYYLMSVKLGNSLALDNWTKYCEKHEEEFSFLKYPDKFSNLINTRFENNVVLPKEFYFDFCMLKQVNFTVKMKQYILQKTTIFPQNYSHEHDIQFIELVAMASSHILPKDVILLIAGHLYT